MRFNLNDLSVEEVKIHFSEVNPSQGIALFDKVSPQIINSIFPNVEQLIINQVFTEAWLQIQLKLQSFAELPEAELLRKLRLAFGDRFDEDTALNIIDNWRNNNWEDIPSLVFLGDEILKGARGAFSKDTERIYLSKELITGIVSEFNTVEEVNSDHESLQELVAVVIEEIGHGIEAKLNKIEIAGDEGAIFSALVMGESLNQTKLQQLKVEKDQAKVVIEEDLNPAEVVCWRRRKSAA